MRVSQEAIEKKRQQDRERYLENCEEKKAYQQRYYAEHKETINRRRKEHGFDKYKMRV